MAASRKVSPSCGLARVRVLSTSVPRALATSGAADEQHAAGHQHDARCVAHLAFFDAWRAVVQRHHLHIALGLATQGLQAAGCGGGVDLRGREGGDHGGRVNQLTANGIVRAATGDQQRGRSRHTGKAKQCHENPSWMTRKEGMVRAPAVQHP